MLRHMKMIARRAFLELKKNADSITIDDQKIYESIQRRSGQLEYIHPRAMIQSTLNYFVPKLDECCKELGLSRNIFTVLDAGARDGWTVEQFARMGLDIRTCIYRDSYTKNWGKPNP